MRPEIGADSGLYLFFNGSDTGVSGGGTAAQLRSGIVCCGSLGVFGIEGAGAADGGGDRHGAGGVELCGGDWYDEGG